MGEGTDNRSWASDESKWSRHWASDEPPSGSIKGSLVGLGLQRFRLCLCQHRREACGGPLLAVGDLAIAEFEGVRNFVFGHNMSKRCMYANQKETLA